MPEASLLTRSERESYDRDGFVSCARPLLSGAEAAHHAALWEACLDYELGCTTAERSAASAAFDTDGNVPTSGGDAVNGHFKLFGGCYDLVLHPHVVQLARDVLGPNICCWGTIISQPVALFRCIDGIVGSGADPQLIFITHRRPLYRQASAPRDGHRMPSGRLLLGVYADPTGDCMAGSGGLRRVEWCGTVLPRQPPPRSAASKRARRARSVRTDGECVRGAPSRGAVSGAGEHSQRSLCTYRKGAESL